MSRAWIIGACLVSLPLVGGCISSDAGYQDTRKLVIDRARLDVRWQHIDGDAVATARTRQILARGLTADGAAQIALLENPALQARFEDIGLARADLVEAVRVPNPLVEGTLRFVRGEQPDIGVSVTESVSQLLFLPLRSGAFHAELDAAKLGVGGAVLDLALDTRIAFYRWQAAHQIAGLRQDVLEAAKASFEAARALHDAGNVRDLDLDTQRVLYEDARLDAERANVAVATTTARLFRLMGIPDAGPARKPPASLPDPAGVEPALADLERRSLAASIDLAIARQRFSAADRRAVLARWQGAIPELRAGIGADRSSGEANRWGVGPVVALEIPLFYQGQGAVDAAHAEMRRQSQNHASLEARVRAAARSTGTRVMAARARAIRFKTVVLPLRQRILDETLLEYNAMSVGVFELLVVRRAQVEAAAAYVEALEDYWVERAIVDQLLAGRLPTNDA